MKIKLIILLSILYISCNSTKNLKSGNWEYYNETGELKTLTIDGNRWIADYCYLRFREPEQWDCSQINVKIKLIGKNKIKLIFDESRPYEWLSYEIIEMTSSKFILEKYNFGSPYQVEYRRSN